MRGGGPGYFNKGTAAHQHQRAVGWYVCRLVTSLLPLANILLTLALGVCWLYQGIC